MKKKISWCSFYPHLHAGAAVIVARDDTNVEMDDADYSDGSGELPLSDKDNSVFSSGNLNLL